MEPALERLVWERAQGRCEYCHIPRWADALPFHIDHVIAQQHGGRTVSANLCGACYSCNLSKGPNLSGRDGDTGHIVRLFHPRRQKWHLHFRWNGPLLVGRTSVGRATIATLGINAKHRLEFREALIADRKYRLK